MFFRNEAEIQIYVSLKLLKSRDDNHDFLIQLRYKYIKFVKVGLDSISYIHTMTLD